MDIQLTNPIDEGPVEIKTPPTATIPEGIILVQRVAELFDLSRSETASYKTKLNTLIEYAKLKSEDHSPDGIKWAIRSLATKVGTPPLGEKLINYLTRYAYLYLESQKLTNELDKYTRGYADNN